MRRATNQEQRWWNQFSQLTTRIPDTIEIIIHGTGEITCHERGARKAQLDDMGNADNVEPLSGLIPPVIDWTCQSILANSEDI